jgi:hypothetical protein
MRRMLALLGAVIGCAYGQSTSMGSRTMTGAWDASNALTTKPAKAGTVLPATCSTGEAFFKTDAAGGQNLYLCKPDDTWTQMTAGGGSAPTMKALLFDGSTTIPGETMSAWSCGSGSGAQCTTSWAVPTSVNWVRVQAWSGGGGGSGSTAGQRGGPGGGGGGYVETVCPTTPGSAVTIAVGLGGAGGTDGWSATGSGGASSFGSCVTVQGGMGGEGNGGHAWGGMLAGTYRAGWINKSNMTNVNPASACASADAVRPDGGGCGGSRVTAEGAGQAGGSATLGGGAGGSGGYNNAAYGAGGISVFGGAGGNGGAWTAAGGVVPCSAGAIRGGGGGAAGTATAGNGNQAGCSGNRGEVRVYYIQ